MSKFNIILKAIRLLIKNPWLLNNVINDDSAWKERVSGKYGMGGGLPVVEADKLLGSLDETIEPFAFLDGGSLPTDLALLKKLAGRFRECRYFEIGTWRGESAANVARVAKSCHTLNLSDKDLRALGRPEKYINLHGLYTKGLDNVVQLEGNSATYDFEPLGKFDLVFIDGDHHYDMVKNDSEKVFSHLVKENTIVVWHDYASNPEQVRFEVLAGILDGTPEKYHGHLYHFANSLCAVYINENLASHPLDPPVVQDMHFKVRISQEPGNNN